MDIGEVALGGYMRVNLRAHYALDDAWTLNVCIENLADHDGVVVHGLQRAGSDRVPADGLAPLTAPCSEVALHARMR